MSNCSPINITINQYGYESGINNSGQNYFSILPCSTGFVSSFFVYTGGYNCVQLPSIYQQNSGQFIFIKNVSDVQLTITGNYGENFYTDSLVSYFNINTGEAYILANAINYWVVM